MQGRFGRCRFHRGGLIKQSRSWCPSHLGGSEGMAVAPKGLAAATIFAPCRTCCRLCAITDSARARAIFVMSAATPFVGYLCCVIHLEICLAAAVS